MDELLLDSTYLLPIFGLKVDLEDFPNLFPFLLDLHSVRYNPAALIEVKWVILSVSKKHPRKKEAFLQAYRTGLRALEGEKRLTQTVLTTQTIETVADDLMERWSVKDYFDRLTYATASYSQATFLTEDSQLLELSRTSQAPKPRATFTWRDITPSLRESQGHPREA